MSHDLPDDWYEEHDGQRLVLNGEKVATEINRLRDGLTAAIRAANLALFVIRKQGVMPNSSWESGFEKDLKTATDARGDGQSDGGK